MLVNIHRAWPAQNLQVRLKKGQHPKVVCADASEPKTLLQLLKWTGKYSVGKDVLGIHSLSLSH